MVFKTRAISAIDFYKADHKSQYPKGTNLVYSNFTPRSARLAKTLTGFDGNVVTFGIQAVVKAYLIDMFNETFFSVEFNKATQEYKRRLDTSLGPNAVDIAHIEQLWDLGYLPLEIKALQEGTLCPTKVPMYTISNTLPEFFWLTNYVESAMSALCWKFITSATIARQYRLLINQWVEETGGTKELAQWQGHDFSFRGMSGFDDAVMSGAGHLLSFTGTDSVLAIDFMEDYYNADSTKELIGGSVPATEHSVMCMGSKESEIETYKRLITEVYPKGLVSIVSDTWDLWKVVTEYTVELKDIIMAREGKVVLRPDSGNPVHIICGYNDSEVLELEDGTFVRIEDATVISSSEKKGCVELLWEIFGGTITDKGYNTIDSHIGLIYGDSITLERAAVILERLADKGFSSDNIVFGIGSYTYEYVTRDTFGCAIKATYGEVNGQKVQLSKDPITDSGVKKSAKGLLRVVQGEEGLVLLDQQTHTNSSLLYPLFKDGVLLRETSLKEIRDKLWS